MFSRSRMKNKCIAKTDFQKKNDKDFFQNENKKKNDIFELFSETKRIFFRGPKRRLIKENQEK